MKKILLASTILVGTAGFAAADNANFTFSGSAMAGVGYATAGAGTFGVEVDSSFTAAMKTMTDGGLEAGASVTVNAPGVAFDDDYTSSTFGALSTSGTSVSDSSVYLSGDWGKLSVAYDGDGSGVGATATDYDVTIKYSNTWGDFGMSAYYTFAVDGAAGTNGDLGATGSYSFGDYSMTASYDYDNSANEHSVGLAAEGTFSGFTMGAGIDYNITTSDLDWNASASYTTGAFTVGAMVEEDDTGTNFGFDAGLTGSYDLGGGVSIDAAALHDDTTNSQLITLGVSMAF